VGCALKPDYGFADILNAFADKIDLVASTPPAMREEYPFFPAMPRPDRG
jgi:hypothetical protein